MRSFREGQTVTLFSPKQPSHYGQKCYVMRVDHAGMRDDRMLQLEFAREHPGEQRRVIMVEGIEVMEHSDNDRFWYHHTSNIHARERAMEQVQYRKDTKRSIESARQARMSSTMSSSMRDIAVLSGPFGGLGIKDSPANYHNEPDKKDVPEDDDTIIIPKSRRDTKSIKLNFKI